MIKIGIIELCNVVLAVNIVGLPDKTVAESRERIRAALNSINLLLPPKRITVNLSPADLLKEGSHYDLYQFLLLMNQIRSIAELFNCGRGKRGNKFTQSA
ncbi:MAG: magnesium chelatase domain-containing protein, partial [Wolbachia sp.]